MIIPQKSSKLMNVIGRKLKLKHLGIGLLGWKLP
jgi:hypothetical protein